MNIILALSLGIVLTAAPDPDADLTKYQWKNRVLLLFSPAESHNPYMAFDRILSKRLVEVRDRDLIVFRIFEKGTSRLGNQTLAPEIGEGLRRRFKVKTDILTVVLIGKDGGVKLVREQKTDLQEIFDLIDSMPMRQQEMREKGKVR